MKKLSFRSNVAFAEKYTSNIGIYDCDYKFEVDFDNKKMLIENVNNGKKMHRNIVPYIDGSDNFIQFVVKKKDFGYVIRYNTKLDYLEICYPNKLILTFKSAVYYV